MGSSCSNQQQPVRPPEVIKPKRAGARNSFEKRDIQDNDDYGNTENTQENEQSPNNNANSQKVNKTSAAQNQRTKPNQVGQRNQPNKEADEDEEDDEDEELAEEGEEEEKVKENGKNGKSAAEDDDEAGEDEEDKDAEEAEDGEDGEEGEDEYDDDEEGYNDEEGDEYEDDEEESEHKSRESVLSDAVLPETVYGQRSDHTVVLRNPFLKKRKHRMTKEAYTVPLIPKEQVYISPYMPKKTLERFNKDDNDENDFVDPTVKKPDHKYERGEYTIEKTLLILKYSVIYEILNGEGETRNLFFFDEGLNQKDVPFFKVLYPRNPYGCPKVYRTGSFDLPGYDTRYYAITEPLSISLGDLLTYHFENQMVFSEDEIIHLFTCVTTALISIYKEIDLHYITEYDIYLDQQGDRFVVTPFTLNRRFEDITENYTYEEIMKEGAVLDPYTNALVEALPLEILKAWEEDVRFDALGDRETSIVYCLGIILFKVATRRLRAYLADKSNPDKFTVDLKFNYKLIPTLIKSTLGVNPASRKPLKFLLETLKSYKYQIPAQATYRAKLNKLRKSEWQAPRTNFRSKGNAQIDELMSDISMGKAYVIALRNVDQGCQFYDASYESLVSITDVDKNLQAKYIEVLFYLSVAMRELDRYDDALEYINEAKLLCEYVYPQSHIMTARVLCEIATIHKQNGNDQEAIEPYVKSLKIYNSFGEVGAKYTLSTISLLIEARIEVKDFATARKELTSMIKSKKYTQKQIGEIYFYLSKVLEGEQLLEDAIDALEKGLYYFEESFSTKDEFFKKILKALVRIAMTIKKDDKVDMLKRHYRDKVPLFLNEIKLEVINVLEQQGAAYKVHENYKQAVEIYQRVAKLKLEIYGKKHPNYVNCREIIANLFEYDGKFEQAIAQYKDVKKAKEVLYGENSLRVINTLVSMAKCFEALGRVGDALRLYREVANIQGEKLGENHKERLRTLEKIKTLK